MNNQEAIEVLKNNFPKTCKMVNGRYKGGFDDTDCDFGKALLLSISALEKQEPKKITHEACLRISCTCPNCKNVVDEFETFGDSKVRVTFNYCHFCGQRLDWGRDNK